MTAPVLRLAGPGETGWQPTRLGHWWWCVREAARTARWRLMAAVVAVVATGGMRRRAWAEGFGVALGGGDRSRLDYLDEWRQGNELADELGYAASGRVTPGPVRPFLLPVITSPAGPVNPPIDRPAPAWPPPVQPRRIVVSEGRHAAPGIASRRDAIRRPATVPRHRRPSPVVAVARWLRDAWPWQRKASGCRGGTGPLRAAA